jgi:hypothetical protein
LPSNDRRRREENIGLVQQRLDIERDLQRLLAIPCAGGDDGALRERVGGLESR